MDIYATKKTAKILEIGSLNVNGSLRDHAKTDSYFGVDLEAGPGVDQVVVPGQPLPFDDNTFDLIMASSVFEHDPAFWNTFLEMCRKARPGGYIYINAPSNGTFHRYPEDHWRFYPDCGLALVRWAQQAGLEVELVESFVADRQAEVYNDFAAVFRKGPTNQPLARTFIYQQVICYNVRTWESDELIHRRDESEDTTIIQRSQRELAELREQLGQRDAQIAILADQVTAEQAKAQSILVDRCVIEQLLRAAELKLEAKEAGVERDRTERLEALSELKQVRRENAKLERKLAKLEEAVERLRFNHQHELKARKKEVDGLVAKLVEQERQARQEREAEAARISELADEISAARTDLAERDRQMRLEREDRERQVRQLVDEADANRARAEARDSDLARAEASRAAAQREAARLAHLASWLAQVDQVLLRQPAWWGLIPGEWRTDRRNALLKRENLFDAGAYVSRYPDVAATRIDPLLHYIRHGMHEDRLPV